MILRFLKIGMVLAALIYLGLAGVIYARQRDLLFRPDPTRVNPSSLGLDRVKEVLLNPPDKPNLIGWFTPATDETKPVFLYLHGNAGNLARRADRFGFLTETGAGLLAVSWRGFGGSEGAPSEAGFHADVSQALTFLNAQNIGPERIVLFGESLGSGIAVMTAAQTRFKALILDSPYDSIQSIAAQRYGWLPVRWMMRDPFRADLAAHQVTLPALVLQCRDDWLTPYENGRRLVDLLGGAKRSVVFERTCHAPPFGMGSGAAIRQFMTDIEAGKPIN